MAASPIAPTAAPAAGLRELVQEHRDALLEGHRQFGIDPKSDAWDWLKRAEAALSALTPPATAVEAALRFALRVLNKRQWGEGQIQYLRQELELRDAALLAARPAVPDWDGIAAALADPALVTRVAESMFGFGPQDLTDAQIGQAARALRCPALHAAVLAIGNRPAATGEGE